MVASGVPPSLALSGAAVGALMVVVLARWLLRAGPDLGGEAMSPAEWLAALAGQPGPVTIAAVRFGPAPAAWTAEEQRTADWRARTVVRRIARRAGARGAACVTPRDGLAWFETTPPGERRRVDRAWLLLATGARLRGFRDADAADGREAARIAARWGLAGRPGAIETRREAPVPLAPWASAGDAGPLDQIVAAFRAQFADGIVYFPGAPAPPTLRQRSARERRAILAAALRSIEGLPPRTRDLPFEVTTWFPGGRLRAIFLVPRASTRRADRARWRSHLRAANLRAAVEVNAAPLTVAEPGVDRAGSGPSL